MEIVLAWQTPNHVVVFQNIQADGTVGKLVSTGEGLGWNRMVPPLFRFRRSRYRYLMEAARETYQTITSSKEQDAGGLGSGSAFSWSFP